MKQWSRANNWPPPISHWDRPLCLVASSLLHLFRHPESAHTFAITITFLACLLGFTWIFGDRVICTIFIVRADIRHYYHY